MENIWIFPDLASKFRIHTFCANLRFGMAESSTKRKHPFSLLLRPQVKEFLSKQERLMFSISHYLFGFMPSIPTKPLVF